MTKQQSGNTLAIVIIIVVVIIGAGAAIYLTTRDTDSDSGNSTATNSETSAGESTGPADQAPAESMPLPDGYPTAQAPIYQPSTIAMATKMGSGWLVTAESPDGIKDVAKSIFDTYKSMGAKVTQEPLNDEGVGQVVGGNDGYGVIITYSTDTDKNVTSISYHVDPQRQ